MSGSRFDYELRMKIEEIYAEADAKIIKELGCDAVIDALRDVQRMRLKVIEKAIDKAAHEKQPREALN